MQTESPSKILDKAMLLVDLKHAGVTDVTGENPFEFFNAEPIAKPKKKQKLQVVSQEFSAPQRGNLQNPPLQPQPQQRPQQTSQAKQYSETSQSQPLRGFSQSSNPNQPQPQKVPVQNPQTTKSTNPSDYIWTVTGGAKALVVMGTDAPKGANPLTDNENILFSKMLACIDLTIDDISFIALQENDGNGINIINNNELSLKKALEEVIYAQTKSPILLLGMEVCNLLSGKPLTQARNMQQITVCDRKAVATYRPKILLKQPAFKRVAWQDLLKFQQLLGS